MNRQNFTREITSQFKRAMAQPGFPLANQMILENSIKWVNLAHRFLLPDGGRLIEDNQYGAIDETEQINLPYPVVALEYSHDDKDLKSGDYLCSKRVLVAREHKGDIVLTPIVYADPIGKWCPFPEIAIPRTNFLNREVVVNGHVSVYVKLGPSNYTPDTDYADEIGAFMCFINALQCSNIGLEKKMFSPGRRKNISKKKHLKGDVYHVLVVNTDKNGKQPRGNGNGTGRTVREHLRRGHIRRYKDGKKTWINATLVNAGSKKGAVNKDYAVI